MNDDSSGAPFGRREVIPTADAVAYMRRLIMSLTDEQIELLEHLGRVPWEATRALFGGELASDAMRERRAVRHG